MRSVLDLKVGEKSTVLKINIVNNDVLRLMTLGIIEQTQLILISQTKTSIELKIYNQVIAISKDLAKNIIVV